MKFDDHGLSDPKIANLRACSLTFAKPIAQEGTIKAGGVTELHFESGRRHRTSLLAYVSHFVSPSLHAKAQKHSPTYENG